MRSLWEEPTAAFHNLIQNEPNVIQTWFRNTKERLTKLQHFGNYPDDFGMLGWMFHHKLFYGRNPKKFGSKVAKDFQKYEMESLDLVQKIEKFA